MMALAESVTEDSSATWSTSSRPRVAQVVQEQRRLEARAARVHRDLLERAALGRQVHQLAFPGVAAGRGAGHHPEDDVHRGEALAHPLPLAQAALALLDHRRQVEPEVDRLLARQLAVLEVEASVGPQEQLIDGLGAVLAQGALHLVRRQDAVRHQDGAQAPPLLLLAEQGLEEVFLRDQPVAHQELAEGLPRVVRVAGLQHALAQDELLVDRLRPDVQGPGLPPLGQPAEQVQQVHGRQIAGQAHAGGLSQSGAGTRRAAVPC
jgi:hypothetical protein